MTTTVEELRTRLEAFCAEDRRSWTAVVLHRPEDRVLIVEALKDRPLAVISTNKEWQNVLNFPGARKLWNRIDGHKAVHLIFDASHWPSTPVTRIARLVLSAIPLTKKLVIVVPTTHIDADIIDLLH